MSLLRKSPKGSDAVQPDALTDLGPPPFADQGAPDAEAACDLSGIRIPHINIHVFRETDAFAETWDRASRDRRMINATTTIFEDGFLGAIQKYTVESTPNVIIVETDSTEDILEFQTDTLAEVCDPGTELIVVGHRNDISLYQKLLSMGVSNYIVYPVTISSIITAIHEIYRSTEQVRIGKIHAVVGAKGGVGASTLAQNVALEMAQATCSEVLLIDMDLCFGTASLNLDVEANQGLRELVDQADKVDAAMLDRVLIKHGSYLNLLGAMPNLVNDRELDPFSVEQILNAAGAHMPNVVLDLPHGWSEWMRRALQASDRVMVVSTPEIGALRNAATMMSQLAGMRPNDRAPALVLNQAGMPGRQEISPHDIDRILKIKPTATIPFDAKLVSKAASQGKMLGDVGPRRPINRAIKSLAQSLVERSVPNAKAPPRKRRLFGLG